MVGGPAPPPRTRVPRVLVSRSMTTPTTFSGARLDRAGERRRDSEWLEARLADPGSRGIGVTTDGVLVTEGEVPRPAYLDLAQLQELGGDQPVLLGVADGEAIFAAGVERAAPGTRSRSLREAGALLSQEDGALLAYAQALISWHRRHGFCGVCGTPTEVREAGHVRACPNCGAQHHPRTDPVVIMLVSDGERVLLGRQPSWPERRYSALAGFVEPGESLEEAVAREVREEALVEVDRVEYHASQPWPFPASLMLGFRARYAGGTPEVGDGELADVRWFERGELVDAVEGTGELVLPPPVAIARRLIDAWLYDTQRTEASA